MDRRKLKILVLLMLFLWPFYSFSQCDLGKNVAVFIGVNDYDSGSGWPDLKFPVQDVNMLSRLLKDHYDFDTIVVRNPDKTAIIKLLRNLTERQDWSANDQLLVFYTGHGKEGYLIPRDGIEGEEKQTAIDYDYFIQKINSIDCQHQLMVVDACYSGSIFYSTYKGNDDWWGKKKKPDENLKVLCQHLSRKTRMAMTASDGSTKAPDRSQLASQFSSLLTKHAGGEEVLYAGMVYQKLKREDTTPLFEAFHDSNQEGSSFLFIPKEVRKKYERASPCPIDPEICKPSEECEDCIVGPSGRTYNLLKHGKTQWMTDNLNFLYDNAICQDCETYGRLYTWKQAQSACGSLGEGWRLPTSKEWEELLTKLGTGYDIPGPGGKVGDPRKTFAELEKNDWNPTLGGYMEGNKHRAAGKQAYFWSVDEAKEDDDKAVAFGLLKNYTTKEEIEKSIAISCRCVKSN